MPQISPTEPSHHCNITHWTHVKEMKWFSSAMLGVLAANNLGFGWALAGLYGKLLASHMHQGHGMPQISHTEPSQHCNITH
jgi:hypothetical protein